MSKQNNTQLITSQKLVCTRNMPNKMPNYESLGIADLYPVSLVDKAIKFNNTGFVQI